MYLLDTCCPTVIIVKILPAPQVMQRADDKVVVKLSRGLLRRRQILKRLPQLYPLMALDDAAILGTFQEAGLSVFEMPAKENSTVWQVIKLPAGVSAAEAGAIYLSGVDKVGAADAARLLNGAWDLKVDRENGVNMVLHFADFKSKSVDAAVQAAIAAEGLTDSSIEKSGEDESGNTYTMGTITGDTGTYSWRVSAIPLSEIYAINGLPEDAVYVGVRMTS